MLEEIWFSTNKKNTMLVKKETKYCKQPNVNKMWWLSNHKLTSKIYPWNLTSNFFLVYFICYANAYNHNSMTRSLIDGFVG